jgi:hypothetical protein
MVDVEPISREEAVQINTEGTVLIDELLGRGTDRACAEVMGKR